MKVLFTTNIPSPYRVDFFNALGKECELTVLFESNTANSREKSWISSDFENFNAVFLKGKRVGEAEAFCPEIKKYLKFDFDIIVIGLYTSPTSMLAIEYMKRHKIPFIINSDGGKIKDDSKIKRLLKNRLISSASAWLSTGEETTKYLEFYGAKKEKTFVYPFTSVNEKDILDAPPSNEEKLALRKKLNIKEEKIVLSVGSFINRKGFDILIESANIINDNSFGFYIVGGEITDEYKILIKKYNLKNIHFLPFMDFAHLAEYYKATDIFVLPTREDIWGLVVNEAMAFGLPVITTDKCGAGLEMINQNENGLIIESENPNELATAILNYKNYNKQFAIETAKKYSIESMAKTHIEIFNMCL